MSATIDRHRRNSIYNAPSSVSARAEAVRKPGLVSTLRVQHREEALKLGGQHREQSLKLSAEQGAERARSVAGMNGRVGDPQMEKKHLAARTALTDRHATEKQRLAAQQKKAMAAAVEREPAP